METLLVSIGKHIPNQKKDGIEIKNNQTHVL